METINHLGEVFGRLSVIAQASPRGDNRTRWICVCDCGEVTEVRGDSLRAGTTVSCGCRKAEILQELHESNLTHGGRNHPLYNIWKDIKQRCLNPNSHAYKWYGALGVKVCGRWVDSFDNFLADVGDRPGDPSGWDSSMPYFTLDRIDTFGDYEPSNVRWASWVTQNNNKRSQAA